MPRRAERICLTCVQILHEKLPHSDLLPVVLHQLSPQCAPHRIISLRQLGLRMLPLAARALVRRVCGAHHGEKQRIGPYGLREWLSGVIQCC